MGVSIANKHSTKKALILVALVFVFLFGFTTQVSANTVPYEFDISNLNPGEPSTYTIKFWVPAELKIGKISVEFGNPYVDFSNATLSVSGISGGTPHVDYYEGTTGHIDFWYKMGSVLTLTEDTWITMTVNGAINPNGNNSSVGIG
jgi:hypothetical protein